MSSFSTPIKGASSSSHTAMTATSVLDESTAGQIRILTFNVWFAEIEMWDRYRTILDLCYEAKADVICFQEVTLSFIRAMSSYQNNRSLPRKDPSLFNFNIDDYLCSDPLRDGKTLQYGYGVLMLVKKSLSPTFRFHDFECSDMGRKLLVADLQLVAGDSTNPIPLEVGTVHLESLGFPHLRRKQLEICAKVLTGKNSILCGDFNFCSWANYRPPHTPLENNVLHEVLPTYSDIWLNLRPGELGYTHDYKKNSVIQNKEQMRLDRIMCRFDSNEGEDGISASSSGSSSGSGDGDIHRPRRLRPHSIKLIGTDPVTVLKPPQAIPVAPSTQSSSAVAADPSYSSPRLHSPGGRDGPSAPVKYVLMGTRAVELFPSDHFGLVAAISLA